MDLPYRHQSHRDLLDRGQSADEIRSARRRGELARLGRGLYVDAAAFERLAPDEAYRVRVGALAARNPGLVVSHRSAAAVLGLPLVTADPVVHLTRAGRGGFRRTDELYVHPGALGPDDVITRAGIRLSSVARTVVDLARTGSAHEAIVVTDAALQRRLVTPVDVRDALDAAGNRKGRPRAVRALARVDGRSESPGESVLRLTIDVLQLPPLDLQVEIRDDDGRFVARVDGGYLDHGVLLEFDGMVKYAAPRRPGQSASDVVVEEKRREEQIARLGWLVVRVMWADLQHPSVLIRRVQQACRDRARLADAIRGTSRPAPAMRIELSY